MRSKLTDEAFIPQVIQEMTLEEKINFIILSSPCISYALDDMDIPPMVLADGATGVNGTHIMLDFLMGKMNQTREQSPAKALGMKNPWQDIQELIAMDEPEALKAVAGNPVKTEFMAYLKNRRNPEGKSISFPSGINIGACFDESAAYRIFTFRVEIARAARGDVAKSVKRTPEMEAMLFKNTFIKFFKMAGGAITPEMVLEINKKLTRMKKPEA